MRNILCLSICCWAFTSGAQNLQFSQALIFTGTTVQTVPAGKVWKVECTGQNYAYSASTSTMMYYSTLVINGLNWYYNAANGGLPSGPLWLPSGTTVAGTTANTLYNIIEFNIVP